MVLEELHELIETLQARIAEHGPALQQSEALTRYALIDPLLRGLGWDTGDPSQVMPEYRSAAGSADYALFGTSNRPQVIIEAKRLGAQLDFKVRQQVTGYCQEEGIPYAAITDGRRWELYDVFKPVAMKDSMVTTLDLEDAPARTALKALSLWRSGVATGSITTGVVPVLDEPSQTTEQSPTPSNTPKASESEHWHPLTDFSPVGGSKPAEVMFPSGVTAAATSWAEAIAQMTQWLLDHGHLQKTMVPIGKPQTKRLLVAVKPAHLDGAPFKGQRQVGAYFIHTGFNASDQMANARFIIERAGQDPAKFAVRLQ
ncbi:MAG: hypothetical protein OXG27_01960 [Chloroflexi bacterium]|nr:hypothetical protein [Chloroflexota bacterium]